MKAWSWTAFRVSACITGCLLVLYVLSVHSAPMHYLEAKLLDMRFLLRGVKAPGAPIAVVLIDDASIAALGRWPWSRQQFVPLMQRLHEAEARLIAFDILFTEPEMPAAREAVQRIRATLTQLHLPPQEATFQALDHTLRAEEMAADPDYLFAMALQASARVLLPFSFTIKTSPTAPETPAPDVLMAHAYRAVRRTAGSPATVPLVAETFLTPVPLFAQHAALLGHVKVAFDTDGSPRFEYPVIAHQEDYYPSLAVQVARAALGLQPEETLVRFGEGIQLGEHFIPTDGLMRFPINYYGPQGTFPTYAFLDVVTGRVPAATFRDQIVLIGGHASGLGDTFVTPFAVALPGVERHATLIANLLRQDIVWRHQAEVWIDLATIFVLGLMAGCGRWGMVLAPVFLLGYPALNILAFTQARLWLNLLFPLLTLLSSYGTITCYRWHLEAQQKRALRHAFQYYLHPSVVEQVVRHPEQLRLGGEQRELTVLFSDIRGFSHLAEQLTPAGLVQFLNEYFTGMTQRVLEDNGLLDKYIGDAVMAVYGAPEVTPDHAYRACHSALRMLDTLATLQAQWQARGLPTVELGIGINSGAMVVGNMGSERHLEYTVIGDEVNLGSRLEGVNKEYGTHILISEATWEQVRERVATRELDVIRVKGKETPTRIFEVLGLVPLTPTQAALVDWFTQGLQAYRCQHWEQAAHCFRQALDVHPHDQPSRLYLARCEAFRLTPPPSDWDGVYVMATK